MITLNEPPVQAETINTASAIKGLKVVWHGAQIGVGTFYVVAIMAALVGGKKYTPLELLIHAVNTPTLLICGCTGLHATLAADPAMSMSDHLKQLYEKYVKKNQLNKDNTHEVSYIINGNCTRE